MLESNILFKSFMPPGITKIGEKKYVVPGWYEVPVSTTLKEVYERWEQDLPESEEKPTHTIEEFVKSSKGDKDYSITFDGNNWNCTCAGFGFRRNCRHVTEIKLKHGIK